MYYFHVHHSHMKHTHTHTNEKHYAISQMQQFYCFINNLLLHFQAMENVKGLLISLIGQRVDRQTNKHTDQVLYIANPDWVCTPWANYSPGIVVVSMLENYTSYTSLVAQQELSPNRKCFAFYSAAS